MYQAMKLLILVVPTVLFFAVDCIDYPDGPREVNSSPNRAQQMKLRGAKENLASEDGYDIAFENHDSIQLFDQLRGKKPKCKTMSKCKAAGGECTKRENCDGKIKKIKKGCSKGCVCCISDDPVEPLQMFDCDNGKKIPQFVKCDGFDNCDDGSDEASCDSCKEGLMQCPNGRCIRDAWKCDGYQDCEDASDETNCEFMPISQGSNGTASQSAVISFAPQQCSGFECSNGRCIISSWKCDDLDDCGDKSDETSCSKRREYVGVNARRGCADRNYACKIYNTKYCATSQWMKENCPKTCKTCTVCEDKIVNCLQYTYYCAWHSGVQEYCPKTCKICQGGTPTCPCGVPNRQRIIGGTEVSPRRKYPWQVGLRERSANPQYIYLFNCGGSIINDRWILTAAHCIVDLNTCRIKYDAGTQLEVVVGEHTQGNPNDDSHETKIYSIRNYIAHYSFVCGTLDYDFGLLELTEAIPFNNNIRPICLPTDDTKTYAIMNGLATGWGRTTNNEGSLSYNLLEVTLTIHANNNCGRWGRLANMKMCASNREGKDICIGDSGGPLAVVENNKYVLVGITSYTSTRCANPDTPAVFARVSKVLPWITATTANGNKCN